jgi:hypothetical protein
VDHVPAVQRPPAQCGKLGSLSNFTYISSMFIFHETNVYIGGRQLETCNGFYCHNFKPKGNMPKIWTENWTGW